METIGQITANNVYVRYADFSGKLYTYGGTLAKGTPITSAYLYTDSDYYVGIGTSSDLPISNEEFVQVDVIDNGVPTGPVWVASRYTDLDFSQPLTAKTTGSNPVPTGLAILGLVGLALLFSRNK